MKCPDSLGHLPGVTAVDLLGRHGDGDNCDEVVGRVEARRTCRALSALCAPCAPLRTCHSTNEEVHLFIGLDLPG